MLIADTRTEALRALLSTRCLSDVASAEGTNAATYKTTATATYTINGNFYSKGATDNVAFSSGHKTLPDGYSCLFVVCLDSSGNFSTVQGRAFKSETDVTGSTKYRGYELSTIGEAGSSVARKGGDLEDYTSAFLPTSISSSVCPVAVIKVATSGATFVPGTTDLGAGTVTDTYYDISVLPAEMAL